VRQATWNAAGCGSGLSESDLELVRSKLLPCGRKRKAAPSLGPATRTARSKCLLLAVESGGRGHVFALEEASLAPVDESQQH
jgi:hypothetical protein